MEIQLLRRARMVCLSVTPAELKLWLLEDAAV